PAQSPTRRTSRSRRSRRSARSRVALASSFRSRRAAAVAETPGGLEGAASVGRSASGRRAPVAAAAGRRPPDADGRRRFFFFATLPQSFFAGYLNSLGSAPFRVATLP